MKYLVLGAGPSGLAFSNKIMQMGMDDFIVLEAEKNAGGLCRSVFVDGTPLDIGGGHFLDTRNPDVCEFLFGFLPEENWNIFERNSQICIGDQWIHHPFEANIWELGIEEQIKYLKSISRAGCNNVKGGGTEPEKFTDWMKWKLGDMIAENYMLPYNKKLFGKDLDSLGVYWLDKLPDVSFEDTLRSCLERKAYARQPGHAHFYYPKKYGYGEVWLRMAEALGDKVQYNRRVRSIDIQNHIVITEDGSEYKADYIISTIPWVHINGLPDELQGLVRKLKHVSIQIDYYEDKMNTNAHWIYYPDLSLSYHRILVRHNFCCDAKGYWTETNAERNIINDKKSMYSYFNEFAYPLNTIDKPAIMQKILLFCESEGMYGLGRWGEHQHYNSDVSVERAIRLAERLNKAV